MSATASCVPCTAGSFAPSYGSVTCQLCQPGTYAPSNGYAMCTNCGMGQQQPSNGSTTCSDCPAGTASSGTGVAVCPACQLPDLASSPVSIGTYSNSTGLTSCVVPVNRSPSRMNLTLCVSISETCPCLTGYLPPDCRRQPDYLDFGQAVSVFFVVVAVILIVITLGIAGYITYHREHPIVKGTSLVFNLLILLGCLTGFISMFMLLGQPTTSTCTAFSYLNAISIALILCSLLIKTYRIWRIFDQPLKIRSGGGALSLKVMLLRTFVIVGLEVVTLVIAGSVSPPEVTEALASSSDYYGLRHTVCRNSTPLIVIVLIWNIAYLIGGSCKGTFCYV